MTDYDADEGALFDEQRAFALRKQYLASLERYATSLGLSLHDARVVAMEALAAHSVRSGDLAPIDNVEAWLVRVVSNKACDIQRTQALETPTDNVSGLVDAIRQTRYSAPADRAEAMEILRTLNRLPESLRVPLELFRQGVPAKKIGEQLGLSEEAVNQRVRRGRLELLKRIEEGRTA